MELPTWAGPLKSAKNHADTVSEKVYKKFSLKEILVRREAPRENNTFLVMFALGDFSVYFQPL